MSNYYKVRLLSCHFAVETQYEWDCDGLMIGLECSCDVMDITIHLDISIIVV